MSGAVTDMLGASSSAEQPTMRAVRFHADRDIRIDRVPAPEAAGLGHIGFSAIR